MKNIWIVIGAAAILGLAVVFASKQSAENGTVVISAGQAQPSLLTSIGSALGFGKPASTLLPATYGGVGPSGIPINFPNNSSAPVPSSSVSNPSFVKSTADINEVDDFGVQLPSNVALSSMFDDPVDSLPGFSGDSGATPDSVASFDYDYSEA